jgi:hypothetical protein
MDKFVLDDIKRIRRVYENMSIKVNSDGKISRVGFCTCGRCLVGEMNAQIGVIKFNIQSTEEFMNIRFGERPSR